MPQTLDPDVDQPMPPTPSDDEGGGEGDGEPAGPWWHQAWRLVVLGVALLLLGVAAGYAWTTAGSGSDPGEGSVDVGFLQDMRWHHDQAVRMGLAMLGKPPDTQDPRVRTIAADVVRSQQFENGVMAGQLRAWGQAEANQSGTGMAWMGMPLPRDRMPGMASAAELDQLEEATGADADLLLLRLMTAHHEGGLHMMVDAESRATTEEARTLARAFREGQEFELQELRALTRSLSAG